MPKYRTAADFYLPFQMASQIGDNLRERRKEKDEKKRKKTLDLQADVLFELDLEKAKLANERARLMNQDAREKLGPGSLESRQRAAALKDLDETELIQDTLSNVAWQPQYRKPWATLKPAEKQDVMKLWKAQDVRAGKVPAAHDALFGDVYVEPPTAPVPGNLVPLTAETDSTGKRTIKYGLPEAGGSGQFTEVMGRATTAGIQMEKALEMIGKLESQGYQPGIGFAISALPMFYNVVPSEDQQYRTAQSIFNSAFLRFTSGAAISDTERKQMLTDVSPRIGDSAEVLAAKRDIMKRMMEAVATIADPQHQAKALSEISGVPVDETNDLGLTYDNPVFVDSPERYNALPMGTYVIDADGNVGRKGGEIPTTGKPLGLNTVPVNDLEVEPIGGLPPVALG